MNCLCSTFARFVQNGLLLVFFLPLVVLAQTTTLDSTQQLKEVTVRGYETNRPILETPASVGVLSTRDLNQRFGTPTLVPATMLPPM